MLVARESDSRGDAAGRKWRGGEQITKEHEDGRRMSPVLVISQPRSVVIEPVGVAAASGGNLRDIEDDNEGERDKIV